MKRIIVSLSLLLSFATSAQNNVNHKKIKHDLDYLLSTLSHYYAYTKEKKVSFKCLQNSYTKKIKRITTEEESVLFFEYILDEFYDSHLILNTNRSSSFRLFSPFYASLNDGKAIITNVWKTQLTNLKTNLLGAEISTFNGVNLLDAVDRFPTECNDKSDKDVKEWIINKMLAGRYNQPRKLGLKLKNGRVISIDLDKLQIKKEYSLLNYTRKNNIGVIRINNSLGRDELVNSFDAALDSLFNTDGLILDLRNTVDGGDTYEARGIMGRFIKKGMPYQKHVRIEHSTNNPDMIRSWVEYVSPRLKSYDKPIVVLVGRWTGSMGEGLAIGLEAVANAKVIGTEMERLAGEIYFFSFKHRNYGFRIPAVKLFHMNGTPRESYFPSIYVKQKSMLIDEAFEKGIEYLKRRRKR